jgi:hypothetical protein
MWVYGNIEGAAMSNSKTQETEITYEALGYVRDVDGELIAPPSEIQETNPAQSVENSSRCAICGFLPEDSAVHGDSPLHHKFQPISGGVSTGEQPPKKDKAMEGLNGKQ